MNRKVLATAVVITVQAVSSVSMAQFAGIGIGGQAGTGIYGGAQACPYRNGAASGASSIQDDMDENIQDQIEVKGDLSDLKSDIREKEKEIKEAKSSITGVLDSRYSDMVFDHIENRYDCCPDGKPRGSALFKQFDNEMYASEGILSGDELIAKYPAAVEDDVWSHILAYDPDLELARNALMTPMRDPVSSQSVASSAIANRAPACDEDCMKKRAAAANPPPLAVPSREPVDVQPLDPPKGPSPAPVGGSGPAPLPADQTVKLCQGAPCPAGPAPAGGGSGNICDGKASALCPGTPPPSSGTAAAPKGSAFKCSDNTDFHTPGWNSMCAGRGKVNAMICATPVWQSGDVKSGKVDSCKRAITRLPELQSKLDEMIAKRDELNAKLQELKDSYADLRGDLKKQIREDARLEASCPECARNARGGRGRTKTNWASVAVGGVLSALGGYAGYSAAKDSNLYNAKLGYPTYSNFPAIASGASVGFPFIAGGLYGGIGSGVNGGFGCAPGGIGGGGYPYGPQGQYGPYGNGANPYGMNGMPFGSPYGNPMWGGGAFNPGVGVGGIAGPWGPGMFPGQQGGGGWPGGGINLFSPYSNAGIQVPGFQNGFQAGGFQIPGFNIGGQIPGFNVGGQIPGFNVGGQIPGFNVGGQFGNDYGMQQQQMQQYQVMLEQQRRYADNMASKLRVQQGLMQEYYSLLSRFQQLNSNTGGLSLGSGSGIDFGGTFGSGSYGGRSGIGIGIGIGGVGSFGGSTTFGSGRFNTAPRGTR